MPGQPRLTVVGPIEKYSEAQNQWNVLVRNVDDLRDFWRDYRIDTKMGWAGMAPPKSTISRKELVAQCAGAGDGALVAYTMELDIRPDASKPEGQFRGVKGVRVTVI